MPTTVRPPRAQLSDQPEEFRVFLHRRGWAVSVVGREHPMSVHATRADALALAERLAAHAHAHVLADEPSRPDA